MQNTEEESTESTQAEHAAPGACLTLRSRQ